jgi:DNA polymerase III psi subunit
MRDYYLTQMGITPWAQRKQPLSKKNPLCVVLWEKTRLGTLEEKLLTSIVQFLAINVADVVRVARLDDLTECLKQHFPRIILALGDTIGQHVAHQSQAALVITDDLSHMLAYPQVKRNVYHHLREVIELAQKCAI